MFPCYQNGGNKNQKNSCSYFPSQRFLYNKEKHSNVNFFWLKVRQIPIKNQKFVSIHLSRV